MILDNLPFLSKSLANAIKMLLIRKMINSILR